jgi:hypothetical protein
VQANSSNNTATVVFTVTKGSNTSNLRDVTVDFGDGSSQSVGTLSGGPATVSHTYSGPSDSSSRTYTATARAVDVNGETTSSSTTVTVTPRGQLTADITADTSSAAVPGFGKQVTFTSNVNGGEPLKFDWDFGDGSTATTTTTSTTSGGGFQSKVTHIYRTNGRYTATVTVTTTDGRTVSARTEFIVSGIT